VVDLESEALLVGYQPRRRRLLGPWSAVTGDIAL